MDAQPSFERKKLDVVNFTVLIVTTQQETRRCTNVTILNQEKNGGDLAIATLTRPINEVMFNKSRASIIHQPELNGQFYSLPLLLKGYGIGAQKKI